MNIFFKLIFLYLIIEDIRKTYVNDYIIYFLFFSSLIYSLIFNNYINIFFGFLIFVLFYIAYYYGQMGDADGFVIASLIFLEGIRKFLILLPYGSLFLSVITILLISIKKRKYYYLISIILSFILLFFGNLIIANLYSLLTLILIFSKKENNYELIKRDKLLDLDTILINNEEYLVLEKENNISDKIKKIKKEDLKLYYYYRKIPIPFLPFLIPYLFINNENLVLCNYVLPLLLCKNVVFNWDWI